MPARRFYFVTQLFDENSIPPGQGVPANARGLAVLENSDPNIAGTGPNLMFIAGEQSESPYPNLAAALNEDFLSLFNYGLVFAGLTQAEIDALENPKEGTLVFNETTKKLNLRSNNEWAPFPGADAGDLTSSTEGVEIQGGNGAILGPGVSLDIETASASQPGLLSAADWNTFNAKQSAFGNQNSNTVFAGPYSGDPTTPSFRAVGLDDFPFLIQPFFGSGADGDVTISSGTTVLTKDMHYNNLTINGTGKISTAHFRIFVRGTLDLTNAPPGAIEYVTTSGGDAVGTAAGAQPGLLVLAGNLGGGVRGLAGQTGGTTTGVNGTAGGATGHAFGGLGGIGGQGGAGASGAGGSAGSTPTITILNFLEGGFQTDLLRGPIAIVGGTNGSGAGSGGGDSVNGGGSGGSGSGAGIVWVSARTLLRGSSTGVGAIRADGGNGGNGGTPAGGNRGGGGGGGAGGGGFVYLFVGQTAGSVATNMVTANGGTGGQGGNGTGTGIGGAGGGGGGAGRITFIHLMANTTTLGSGSGPTVRNPPSGATGGAASAGSTCQISV